MSKLETLECEIKGLSVAELAQVKKWLEELEADAWDAQIEADSIAGRLKPLEDEARAAIVAGHWNRV